MEPTSSSDAALTAKSQLHSRHASFNRLSLPRRSTIGPLDMEDPLGAGTPPVSSKDLPNQTTIAVASLTLGTTHSYRESPVVSSQVLAKKFSYLLRPEIYHTLTQLDLPPAFRTPLHQSDPSLPSSSLLLSSNFRSAAIVAANELSKGYALSVPEIFSHFYTRLACLTLIDGTAFAAEESKALEDLTSSFYRDDDTHLHLMPWELRVLAVRLQGIGYGDLRRAISGYYDLAQDAREEITKNIGENRTVWKERLEDLSLRVGNALVEMGDVSGAIRHFKSLHLSKTAENTENLTGRLAMLYMRLGDLTAAKNCIEAATGTGSGRRLQAALQPLLSMTEGRYDDAISEWRDILTSSESIMATQNLAVCLLYVGRIEETSPLLTSLISAGHSFHALTFNLATVYELCTEKAQMKKMKLAETIATRMKKRGETTTTAAAAGEGGERSNSDFKL